MFEAAARLLAAVRWLQEQEGRDPEELTLGFTPAPEPLVAGLQNNYGLPDGYVHFLRHFASEDFVDTGLRWRGVACWVVTASGFEDLHDSYAGLGGWSEAWKVVAAEYEGCYFLDVRADRPDESPVYYLEHSVGYEPRDLVADSFEAFLGEVADASIGELPTGDEQILAALLADSSTELDRVVVTSPAADEPDDPAPTPVRAFRLTADLACTSLLRHLEARHGRLGSAAERRRRLRRVAADYARSGCDRLEALYRYLLDSDPDQAALDQALLAVVGHAPRGLECARDLIERGARIAARDRLGRTPLLLALVGGQADIASMAMERGADVNAADRDGVTALMLAAGGGDLTILQELLARGADLGRVDSRGRSAMAYASRGGPDSPAAHLLSEHGAAPEAWPVPEASAERPQERMSWPEKLGCAVLLVGSVVMLLVILWFRYC
jgi:hypothetical protein